MRCNKYGIRGLKSVQRKRGVVYFWVPPLSLQRVGAFKHKNSRNRLRLRDCQSPRLEC